MWFVHIYSKYNLCKDEWTPVSHPKSISLHNTQIGSNSGCKIGLVYYLLQDGRNYLSLYFYTRTYDQWTHLQHQFV